MVQPWENGENPNCGPNLGPPCFFHVFHLYYHSMQFKGKIMNQTWENSKNLVLGSILAHLAQIWVHKICFVDFTLTSS